MLNSKWYLAVAAACIVILSFTFLSRKSVKAEIFIPADASSIWSVLLNTSDYARWNPVLTPISGQIKPHSKIQYRWNQPNGQTVEIESAVIAFVENELLHQKGGTAGLLTFDHRYTLETDDAGTWVIQSEVYRGIGVWFWDAQQMESEYQKVNAALKKRVISIGDGL